MAANTGTNTTNAASAVLTEDRNLIEISSQSQNDEAEIPVTPNECDSVSGIRGHFAAATEKGQCTGV
jgi:hypothetical protein